MKRYSLIALLCSAAFASGWFLHRVPHRQPLPVDTGTIQLIRLDGSSEPITLQVYSTSVDGQKHYLRECPEGTAPTPAYRVNLFDGRLVAFANEVTN